MTMISAFYVSLLFVTNQILEIETCHSVYYPATKCIDKLDHYECLCGQGQIWNGYTCIVDAVDSRLVFNGTRFPSYIELNSKTFPRISEFTISFWIRIWPKADGLQHTILFYRTDDILPVLLVSVTEYSHLHVEILNRVYDTSMSLVAEEWHHVAIAHNLFRADEIKIMINGSMVVVLTSPENAYDHRRSRSRVIDSGGDFFVGQMLPTTNTSSIATSVDLEFDSRRALFGELAFLNIWQKMFSDNELQQLAIDCHVQRQECGDAVAWMDFVNDINGEIRIHWPSSIFDLFANCPSQRWLQDSCDTYCRKLEGPHCKNESQMSIIWQKALAGQTVVQECPGNLRNGNVYRTCQKIEKIARWTHVDYSECTHPLVNRIDEELETRAAAKADIILLRDKCAFLAETTSTNLTNTELYSSIDLILLIEQIERLTKILTSHFDSLIQWFSLAEDSFYLDDINSTLNIHRYLLEAISNLIDERYQSIWIETNPLGNDFLRLLTSVQKLTNIVGQVLKIDCHQYPGCSLTVYTGNINQTIQVQSRNQVDTFFYENLETLTRLNMHSTKKIPVNNKTIVSVDEKDNASNWYVIAVTTFRTAHMFIPNLRLGRVSKYDNINSHVVAVDIKVRKPLLRSEHLATVYPIDPLLINLHFGYLKHDNISGNRCVYLDIADTYKNEKYKPTLFRQWRWQSSPLVCNISLISAMDRGVCSCLISDGIFAMTSDMFDPNWRPVELRLRPLDTFSYIGCCIHIFFAVITLVMLSYLRTRSSAAYIHKHYAFVLCCSQIVLIVAFNGIPYHHVFLCRAVACLTHFLILSSYCWLMNEAFNLYIQITYTTHPAVAGASTALSDAASKYRFLGMGYILPFCIVTLLASIKKSSYFMPIKMRLCFIDLDDWFKTYFIPISAIIFITVMVMIFSAKQHHESSYTKNEKANEVIVTYTGGIWSQLFLITITWSLAILPYFYDETILRLLHGFFNSLQGGFLFLSFFLFNDEIRRHYRDRRRQLRRIQLMEVPYRTSIEGSEEQGSTILVPSISPQTVPEAAESSQLMANTKVTSFASTVSLMLNRNRQSFRHSMSEESKQVSPQKSLKSVEMIIDENSPIEEDKDYRISVV